jgi:hypothetical protein
MRTCQASLPTCLTEHSLMGHALMLLRAPGERDTNFSLLGSTQHAPQRRPGAAAEGDGCRNVRDQCCAWQLAAAGDRWWATLDDN